MKLSFKIIIVFVGFLWSCEDVVNVSVPDGGERLVIEASINWEKGTSGQTQTIKLSKSTEYFASDPNVPVTGALIEVFNNNSGATFVFIDQNDGTYVTSDFIPVIDDTYTLNITYNNENYSATETFMPVSNITEVEQNLVNGFDDNEIQLKVYFNDPAGTHNYYLGEFDPSHKPLLDLSTLDDEFSNGNRNFIEYDDEDLTVGDTVTIGLYGISEQYYNYITLLIDQSGDGGPFTTTPAQLKGNCININNANEEVLGYFRLGEVAREEYVIE